MTELLQLAESGSKDDLGRVYQAFYQRIKNLAISQLSSLPASGTITPTVLMHECYLKMMQGQPQHYTSSKHFMCAMAKSMRHFLIDAHRAKQSQKRKGAVSLSQMTEWVGDADGTFDLLDLERVFTRIGRINPMFVELIELKLFAGCQVPQLAELFNCSRRTIIRDWERVKTLILALLDEGQSNDE